MTADFVQHEWQGNDGPIKFQLFNGNQPVQICTGDPSDPLTEHPPSAVPVFVPQEMSREGMQHTMFLQAQRIEALHSKVAQLEQVKKITEKVFPSCFCVQS